ncbi:HAD hydrolase-like protein [Candidatus Parcubacteria bacterium]|nr:HAD hydrolase-like protein [Candidatus Parcubacteria bacterium]
MKIIFDFDHTLFETEKFRKVIKKNLEKGLNQSCQFLYPDVIPLLRKVKKNFELFILSFGEEKFQKKKIQNSKIAHYFKKIVVTPNIAKMEGMKKILKKQETAIFIDDNPQALLETKKFFPNLITIRMNRGEGRYFQKPNNKKIDYCVKNLKEFEAILRKIYFIKSSTALVLFSGGLDSILVAKILQKQGIKITGITFKSYFFGAKEAKKSAKNLGIKLKIIDISKEHLKVMKSPEYGYGKEMNPCLDCRILMLKKAKEIMEKEKYGFIATGEVLGQRPMTQNKKSLEFTEKKSSLEGLLIRPLSAKPFNISGRSRKKQIALAKKFKVKQYPSPSGGCLLTDPEFSKRFKKLLKIYPQCQGNDIELLKVGRHFWLKPQNRHKTRNAKLREKIWVKIIVGRNNEENKKIKKLAKPHDILIEMKDYPGPLALIRNYQGAKLRELSSLNKAKKLTQYYSTKTRNKKNMKFKISNIK